MSSSSDSLADVALLHQVTRFKTAFGTDENTSVFVVSETKIALETPRFDSDVDEGELAEASVSTKNCLRSSIPDQQ